MKRTITVTEAIEHWVRARHADRLVKRLTLPGDDDSNEWILRAALAVVMVIVLAALVTQ